VAVIEPVYFIDGVAGEGPLVLCTAGEVRLVRAGRGRAPAVHRLESGAGFRVLVG
jgi:hypothetical protein